MKEPNKYKVCGESTAIYLVDIEGNHKAFAWIDTEDLERIKPYRWCLNSTCPVTEIKGYTVCLHQFIMNTIFSSRKVEVDHKDRNQLNNRKENLRICTHKKNMQNMSLSKLNTSGTKGVSWSKRYQYWVAYINNNEGKRIHLGSFVNKQNAIAARKAAEQELGYI